MTDFQNEPGLSKLNRENKNRKSAVESKRAGQGKTVKTNHCTGKIGKNRVYP